MKVTIIPGFALVIFAAFMSPSLRADFLSPFSSQKLYACMESKKSDAPEWVDCLESFCKAHDKCHNVDLQAKAFEACTQDHDDVAVEDIQACFEPTY